MNKSISISLGGLAFFIEEDAYAQLQQYFTGEAKLPRDAAHFIDCICAYTRSGKTLQSDEFQREMLD